MSNDNDPSTFTSLGDAANSALQSVAGERIWNGKPITESGIYSGVPINQYHNDTGLFIGPYKGFSISSSGLRKFIERPLAYWSESPFNPNRIEPEDKQYFSFGRAAHHLLLGEKGFAEHFVKQPATMFDEKTGKDAPWHGGRTVCKNWTAEQCAAGKSIITDAELEKINWIADSLSRHPLVQTGVLSGKVERSLMVRQPTFWLRNRPDNFPISSGDIVDLKTAADVSDEGISKAIYSTGLHIQAATGRYAYEAVFGQGTFNSFNFVFVEKSPPFDVRVVRLKDGDIDRGTKLMLSAFRSIDRCLQSGVWPGYDGIDPGDGWVEMPAWAQKRIDETILTGEAA